MRTKFLRIGILLVLAIPAFLGLASGQDQSASPNNPPPAAEPPPLPKGVEVMARGPVHEAFATPTSEPVPTQPVPKKPPQALEEMPPDTKPEGDVVWINGYWAWDDDRKDFLWVSGIWRTVPPGKHWVAGYWREEGEQAQWVAGFWGATAANQTQQASAQQEVTYLPQPPAPPETAAPGEPPTVESFYVPGVWVWNGDRYAWRAGYWARVQPGYVWVAAHYRWTPGGYVYIAGYWDYAVARRGVLFAPVFVDTVVVGPRFVYSPAYVVSDTIVLDALFVRPCYCHYYFGDYYGPAYRDLGFETCVVYSRRHYDGIYVYARWEHRDEPHWATVQLDICLARNSGRAPCPPRTLVQQNVFIQNNVTNVNVTNVYQKNVINNGPAIVPVSQMAAVKKMPTVTLNTAARVQASQQAQVVQQVAQQRVISERPVSGGAPSQPRVATLNVPQTRPVSSPGGASAYQAPKMANRPATTNAPSTTTPGSAIAHPSALPPAPHSYNTPTRPGGSSPYGPNRPGYPPGRPGGNQPPSNRPMPYPARPMPPKPQPQQQQNNNPPPKQ
jgi:hypothetical protein